MWNPSRATAALELGQVSRKHFRLQFPWLLVGADSSYILLAWYLTLPIIIESRWSPLLSIPNEVPALLPHPSASVPRNKDAGPAIVALDGMTQTSLHYYCMLHAIERISNVRETTYMFHKRYIYSKSQLRFEIFIAAYSTHQGFHIVVSHIKVSILFFLMGVNQIRVLALLPTMWIICDRAASKCFINKAAKMACVSS